MSSTEPRSGLKYGWSPTTENFSAEMDANLLWLGRFGTHLSVKDRDLATPPGSPTAGDTYIIAASPTGAWASKATQLTLWTGSAWVFAVPRVGMLAYIEDEQKLTIFKSGAWSAGIAI